MEVCETSATVGTQQEASPRRPDQLAAAQAREDLAGAGDGQAAARADAVLASWVAVDLKSKELLEQVQKLAQTVSTVLIRGESGAGKDLLAGVVHYLSPRADEPLVKIDCAGLPPALMEGELFGYERGGSDGAAETRRGCLEIGGRGTLVLDEVAALSMPLQAKLLRVLEEKQFLRVGGNCPVSAEVRIVALTSVDLDLAVARRTFRQDLYYRLSVVPLVVPPLRQRPADIPALAARLLAQLSEIHRKPHTGFAAPAMAALERYSFPGNVRELRNLIERAVLYSNTPELALEDFPAQVRQAATGGETRKMSLQELERAHIAEVLDYTHGKKTRAAEILGISRKTLLEKRKRYGLD